MLSKNKINLIKNLFRPFKYNSFFKVIKNYIYFIRSWKEYNSCCQIDSDSLTKLNWFPCLFDRTSTTQISDIHYFYMGIWAAKRIQSSQIKQHVDVGSQAQFVGFITSFTDVIFVDIRPLAVTVKGLTNIAGSILRLPFEINSVDSLSCLHVAEHIGLGRYGDPIDPKGFEKACKELSRVVKPSGFLYFATPIGKHRVCFNAHRVSNVHYILEHFSHFDLIELSVVTDDGRYLEYLDPSNILLADMDYGCGLFLFRKRA